MRRPFIKDAKLISNFEIDTTKSKSELINPCEVVVHHMELKELINLGLTPKQIEVSL